MEEKTVFLKNMICSRCINVVKYEMEKIGVEITSIDLAKMRIRYSKKEHSLQHINSALEKHGLSVIRDNEEKIVSQIKLLLRTLINDSPQMNFHKKTSEYLSKQLGHNYSHLSRLFTKHENTTIEKYLILLKIERVKELLEYDEQTLSDISKLLAYSSTQHLSRQFKLTTGISISEYKKFLQVRRISPDKF